MNGSCETPEEQLCGCCQGLGSETPEPISNRPGLSQIRYRTGTHATFKASLLAALSDSNLPALAPLRTRDDSDFSIALLDAWAVGLDILTFYQERLANEAYLGTAVDAASVMSLARLVGYKPSPGVAASAFLAFMLTSARGAPDNVLIPAGTRVQSVPKPGQTPQVFETSSDLTALIGLNAAPPQTSVEWHLSGSDISTWVQGTANNIKVGDALLFLAAQSGQPVPTGPGDVHYVTAVNVDPVSGNTQIFWDQPLSTSFTDSMAAEDVSIFIFRKKTALYGAQAPNPLALGSSASNPNLSLIPGYPASVQQGADWSFYYQEYSNQINLDASYPGLAPQTGAIPPWIVLTGLGYISFFQIKQAGESNPGRYTLTSKTTQLTLDMGQILTGDTSLTLNEVLWEFVQETRNITAYIQSDPLTPADFLLTDWIYDDTYMRQSGSLRPVEGSTLGIVTTEALAPGRPVAVFGKRLRLQVANFGTMPPGSQPGFVRDGATGSTPLSDGQVFLIDQFPPNPITNSSDMFWPVLTPDGVSGTLRISTANVLLIGAGKNDPVVGESMIISQAGTQGPIQTLDFKEPLARIYDRATVTLSANVVAATNGETMHEIMGSGDATNAALRLSLKQSPLTYVSSPRGLGADSTLQVWVNNLRWHEVENFLASGPNDRIFVTQPDSAGKVTVQFGDGVEGTRTPTGQMNIRAVYRKGVGAAGNVDAGQLSQALDRPQGLKAVTNPGPATVGADPDSAASARVSAPLHVLTLERAVSLEDYQNYALAFAGIAKALATWTWVGRMRAVFLTVAGANGTVLKQDDPVITHLIKALRGAGNPYVPVTVASYVPVLIEIGANVRVDADNYDPAQVLGQVWQALQTNLSFDQRQPGQGLAQSEVIALMQSTPGVIGVELTTFRRQGQFFLFRRFMPRLPAVLCASAPVPGEQGTPQGAEMLTLDPASQGRLEVWS